MASGYRILRARQIDALLELWREIIETAAGDRRRAPDRSKTRVSDRFGAAADDRLPSVALALDPAEVRAQFKHRLPRLGGAAGRVLVRSIQVTRHKPGKRCVIEYDVRVRNAQVPALKATLIGKIRARRSGNKGYRLLDALWNSGFQSGSADGVSVPEPIGVIPRFQMWLQRKVPGSVALPLLAGPEGRGLARRIAEALHKLHRAGVPTDRRHTMADELRILHECLPSVTQSRPALAGRIDRILEGCDRLGARVPAPKTCGIHRDFYPSQILVDGARLHLIDFDLYCEGDPALDVGNFIAHVTETSLRLFGDPAALSDREEALAERFWELSGQSSQCAVRAYTTLTLVRHIYLSSQFPERASFTDRCVELCEERLAAAGVL